ncbi:hypothetical protein [Nocardia sp. NBC_01730]|uniref:hypothetical protein n=1 Tax=Nocardia sp. NBC_01730 TaxID=2975998 RepID=UPI003FA35F1B
MQQITVVRARTRSRARTEAAVAAAAAALVTIAFAVPQILSEEWRQHLYAAAAPIFGIWDPHLGWGTGPAMAIAAAVVLIGPDLATRLPWRQLLAGSWLAAVAWTFALSMIDGWQVGFAGRLTRQHEYLYEVPGVHDIPAMLRGFSDRILDFQPDSWTTHVSGHPPGALLVFVLLDRVGLGGGAWAGWLCVLVGCSAATAVPVALKALGAPEHARAATPFLVLAPAAVWVAVSADAFFTGVAAWGVALLAMATRLRPGWPVIAGAAGLLLGFGLYLNYGLVLMAIPAGAVLVARGFRPAVPALLGVALVVAAFSVAGFWWPDGYHLVVQRYYQGIAAERPYSYWVWGNLAATVCAVGLATAAATPAALRGLAIPDLTAPLAGTPMTTQLRERLDSWRAAVDPVALLAAAAAVAILAADLSGLSKAETERIWLPFDMWLLGATALLPQPAVRSWLAVQALAALLINSLLMTNW